MQHVCLPQDKHASESRCSTSGLEQARLDAAYVQSQWNAQQGWNFGIRYRTFQSPASKAEVVDTPQQEGALMAAPQQGSNEGVDGRTQLCRCRLHDLPYTIGTCSFLFRQMSGPVLKVIPKTHGVDDSLPSTVMTARAIYSGDWQTHTVADSGHNSRLHAAATTTAILQIVSRIVPFTMSLTHTAASSTYEFQQQHEEASR